MLWVEIAILVLLAVNLALQVYILATSPMPPLKGVVGTKRHDPKRERKPGPWDMSPPVVLSKSTPFYRRCGSPEFYDPEGKKGHQEPW